MYAELFTTASESYYVAPASGSGAIVGETETITRSIEYPAGVEAACAQIKTTFSSPEVYAALVAGEITCEQLEALIIQQLDNIAASSITGERYQFPSMDNFNYTLGRVEIPPPNIPGQYYSAEFEMVTAGALGSDAGERFFAYIELNGGAENAQYTEGPRTSYFGLNDERQMSINARASSAPETTASLIFDGWIATPTITTGYNPALVDLLMPDFCPYNPQPEPGINRSLVDFNPITPETKENEPWQIGSTNPPTETVIRFANHTYEMSPIGMRK